MHCSKGCVYEEQYNISFIIINISSRAANISESFRRSELDPDLIRGGLIVLFDNM